MATATEPTLTFYAQQIDSLLQKAIAAPESRLHWVTLASVHSTKQYSEPDLRIVVLRAVDKDRNLLFYTDSRSPKTDQFKSNPKASVLLFDPVSMMQLRIFGEVRVDTDSELHLNALEQLTADSRINYSTLDAPGTPSASWIISHDAQKTHFALLKFQSQTFDLLHLRRKGALRIQATNGSNQQLEQLRWITP